MKLSVLTLMVLLVGAPVAGRAQDMDANYQSLRDAESKGDAGTVKQLATVTAAQAKEAAAEAVPDSADEKESYTKRIEYAKSVQNFCEYALFSVAVKSQPAVTVDLMATLETLNPKSRYLDEGYANYLYALNQTGAAAKIPAIAEKSLANLPDNPDILSVLTESSFAANQLGRAAGFAVRLAGAAGKRGKPEGQSDADWEKRKAAWFATSYYVSGVAAGQSSQYAAADKSLRAALPYLRGNNARLGPALFYLGVANYNLGKMTMNKAKMLEGAKFSDECAAIPGSLAQQCWTNSANIKKEAGAMR